jgi:hypothetical protein
MLNATSSEIHMAVLLPVLQMYSTWNLVKEGGFADARRGQKRMWRCPNVLPSGCDLENNSTHKDDTASQTGQK